MSSEDAIVVKNLKKSFKNLIVLDGVSFNIKKGEVLALLGPNGAGKTTTIRILSTLLRPDEGEVFVNGKDVVKEAGEVRSSIGLTGQYAAVDEYLSGKENLEMIGRLYRLSIPDIKIRTEALLKKFDLSESANRVVKTYSGGMRRRIDLAMSLISSPPVLFLDEPTTGLDPRSRLALWEIIRELAATDVTVLLTTQYMEEADNLADRIVVIDNGKVIAEGTAEKLKDQVGSERLEFVISQDSSLENAKNAIEDESAFVDERHRKITVATKGGARELSRVLNSLENAGITVESLSLHRPTLDDVFLTLTGRTARVQEEDKPNEGDK
jgi:ABC-2 type transport system ATP-binding protein